MSPLLLCAHKHESKTMCNLCKVEMLLALDTLDSAVILTTDEIDNETTKLVALLESNDDDFTALDKASVAISSLLESQASVVIPFSTATYLIATLSALVRK